MKKRYLAVGGLFAGLASMAIAVLALLPHWPGETEAKLDRVQIGMSYEDAEGVFGRRPNGVIIVGGTICDWDGDDGNARIIFIQGKVTQKDWTASPPRSIIKKLWRWIRSPAK